MKLSSLFSWIAIGIASTCATGIAESAEPDAQANFTFLDHIPANCDNLFVVGDPLPAMRRAFESDTFHDFATNSRLAKKFMEIGTNFAQTEFMLDTYAKNIPSELAVGIPSSSYVELEQLARMVLAMELCGGAIDVDGEAIANDLPEFQRLFLEAALAFKLPQCAIWLRFREEQTAVATFDAIVVAAQKFAEESEIPVTFDDTTLHFDFLLTDLVSADSLPFFLAEMGLGLDSEEKALKDMSDAVANGSGNSPRIARQRALPSNRSSSSARTGISG